MKRAWLLFLLFIPATSHATTAWVSAGVTVIGGAGGVSTLTTGSYTPHATGNILVAFTGSTTSTITINGVADVSNSNHAFTQGTSCRNTDTTNSDELDVWYEHVQSLNSTTFTVTYSTSATFGNLTVEEFSGVDTQTPFDKCTLVAHTTASPLTSPSFTPTQAGDENVFFVRNPGGGVTTWTAGTNYTVRHSSTTTVNYATETRDNAPSGSQTAAITQGVHDAYGTVISLNPFLPRFDMAPGRQSIDQLFGFEITSYIWIPFIPIFKGAIGTLFYVVALIALFSVACANWGAVKEKFSWKKKPVIDNQLAKMMSDEQEKARLRERVRVIRNG